LERGDKIVERNMETQASPALINLQPRQWGVLFRGVWVEKKKKKGKKEKSMTR